MQEKLLIVGCGDIGQRLAARLSPLGYAVTGLRRRAQPANANITYRQCDATQAQALKEVLNDGFDVVVISMTPSERSDSGYQRAYVDTCRNLVAGLGEYKPRLVVFVSSTAVYGQDDGSWVDESSPAEPEGFSGKRLLEAEDVIRQSGLAHIIVRFSGIYGPGRNRLIDMVRSGRASLSPHYTNRIHADDCAGVLAHVITRSATIDLATTYIATDSAPAPMKEVMQWLADKLDVPLVAEEVSGLERGNKRCSNQALLASGYQFQFAGYQQGYSALLGKDYP